MNRPIEYWILSIILSCLLLLHGMQFILVAVEEVLKAMVHLMPVIEALLKAMK